MVSLDPRLYSVGRLVTLLWLIMLTVSDTGASFSWCLTCLTMLLFSAAVLAALSSVGGI